MFGTLMMLLLLSKGSPEVSLAQSTALIQVLTTSAPAAAQQYGKLELPNKEVIESESPFIQGLTLL